MSSCPSCSGNDEEETSDIADNALPVTNDYPVSIDENSACCQYKIMVSPSSADTELVKTLSAKTEINSIPLAATFRAVDEYGILRSGMLDPHHGPPPGMNFQLRQSYLSIFLI